MTNIGSAFISGINSGRQTRRSPMQPADLSGLMKKRNVRVVRRGGSAPATSVLDENEAKAEKDRQYVEGLHQRLRREEMQDQANARAEEKHRAEMDDNFWRGVRESEDANFKRLKGYADLEKSEMSNRQQALGFEMSQRQKQRKFEMSEEQHRRMNGFLDAVAGLYGGDARLLRSGWKDMVPSGGKFNPPYPSFNRDGTVNLEFSNGAIARGTANQIYRQFLGLSAPTAERPAEGKKRSGGDDFFNKEEYKALLRQRNELSKALTKGEDPYGAPIPRAEIEADLAEVNRKLDSLSGKTTDGGIKYISKDEGKADPDAPPVSGAKKAKDGNWYVQKNGKWFMVDTKKRGGKSLDEETAMEILKEAGGDKEKAREIAKSRGYDLGGGKQRREKRRPLSSFDGGDSGSGGDGD